jgi:hypothetical protein
MIFILMTFLMSGCFKVGYQIEIGSVDKTKSSYDAFYRSPAFYNK